MKDKYTQIISFSANDHNVKAHDAIMIEFSNSNGTAQIYPFGEDVPRTVKGDPKIQNSTYNPATGDGITFANSLSTIDTVIHPIQVKGIGALSNANVYGLKR